MITELVARISTGGTTIGTGYSVADGLILTAWHVVKGREAATIDVEWLDLREGGQPAKKSVISVQCDDWETFDIALLHVPFPQSVKSALMPVKWCYRMPKTQQGWESLGFPWISHFSEKGLDGHINVDSKKPRIAVKLNDKPTESVVKQSGVDSAWVGISGAPVFSIDGGELLGVIIEDNQLMQGEIVLASIPWLLRENAAFRQAVGYAESNHTQQFFLDECVTYLESIKDSSLFLSLHKGFVDHGLQSNAETLLNALQVAITSDPVAVLEKLRLRAEPVMATDRGSVEQAKTLLCLVLNLVAAASGQAESNGIHELAVRTRMMVEVSLATRYRVRSDLKYEKGADVSDKGEVVGCYALDGECLREVGWKPNANAQEIAKTVNVAVNKAHKQVYGSEPKNTLDEFDLAELNATLLTRRKNERPQLIRFEVATSDALKETHPLHDAGVCAALHDPACLPDLPIVRYGLGTATKEAQLRAQVNEFFRIIQQYS